jgi:putative membrane protein
MDQNADGGARMTTEDFKLRLQLETSLLVWVRTSLALMGFGFVVARFGLFLREIAAVNESRIPQHPRLGALNTFTGTALIVLGVVVLLLSVWGHRRTLVHLERGELPLSSRWSLAVVLSFVVAALGLLMAVYLTTVDL